MDIRRKKFRDIYMGVGSVLVIMLWLLTDPDLGLIQTLPFGAMTVASIVATLKMVFYIALVHLARRALLEYVDLEQYFEKALKSPEGAGMALIAVALFSLTIAAVMYIAVIN